MGGIHLWNFVVHTLLYVENKLMKPNPAVKKSRYKYRLYKRIIKN